MKEEKTQCKKDDLYQHDSAVCAGGGQCQRETERQTERGEGERTIPCAFFLLHIVVTQVFFNTFLFTDVNFQFTHFTPHL